MVIRDDVRRGVETGPSRVDAKYDGYPRAQLIDTVYGWVYTGRQHEVTVTWLTAFIPFTLSHHCPP